MPASWVSRRPLAQAVAAGIENELNNPQASRQRIEPQETGFSGCGKTSILSFRGWILPEESAFFLGFAKKQIPRCARDDNTKYFFRSLVCPFSGNASPLRLLMKFLFSRSSPWGHGDHTDIEWPLPPDLNVPVASRWSIEVLRIQVLWRIGLGIVF